MATATPDEERALLPRTATSDSPTTADFTATGPPTHSPPDGTAGEFDLAPRRPVVAVPLTVSDLQTHSSGQQLRLHEKFPITCGVVWVCQQATVP